MKNNQPSNESKPSKPLEARDSALEVNQEDDQYFIDQFEKNGIIAKAKIHYSAQSVNKIPDQFDAKSNLD
jgi:hypothetical protein